MKHYGDITKLSGYELPIVDCITGGLYKVYIYRFPDGKQYVGMTKHSLQSRKDCGYQHNKRLTDAIRTTGWDNVEKIIVQEGLSIEEAETLEKDCIHTLKTTDKDKGYNVSFGGRQTFAGLHHTEEHKAHIRNRLKGRVFSAEHINNLREAHRKQCCQVSSINPEDKTVTHYDSLGAAAIAVGGHKSNISRACANEGKVYKGLLWRKGVV